MAVKNKNTISPVMKLTESSYNTSDAQHERVQALMFLPRCATETVNFFGAKHSHAPAALPNPPSAMWMLHSCQVVIITVVSTEARDTQCQMAL